MRALVFQRGRVGVETQWISPRLESGREAVVDVMLAGVCATDLEITAGYMGFEGVLGHEFVGVARDGKYRGKRVVGEINAACGQCQYCARGLQWHCPTRTVLGILGRDGAFADSLSLPEENLHLVPDGVSDEAAVFTEPLAAAFAILDRVRIEPGSRAAVLGDGRLGQLSCLALRSAGARVLCSGRHPQKSQFLSERGVELWDSSRGVPEEWQHSTPVVVDATGSARGIHDALEWVAPRGTLILKTTTHDAPPQSLARIVIDEIDVLGSRCGRFEPALDALAKGLDPTFLIEERFPLERGVEALDCAGRRGVRKVLIGVHK